SSARCRPSSPALTASSGACRTSRRWLTRASSPSLNSSRLAEAPILKRIAVIPGDGVGPEVMSEAVQTLELAAHRFHLSLSFTNFDWSAEKYLATGVTLPPGALEMLSNGFDAILSGAFGDSRVPDNRHARDILLGMRMGLDLYINLRPIKLLDARLCPLASRGPRDIDFVVFRENTEGMYVFAGGNFKKGSLDEVAIQEEINTRKGVERIIVAAFEHARSKGRPRVTMGDKSNVLTYGHDLWQRTFKEIAAGYPDIQAEHLYIDVLAMWMV